MLGNSFKASVLFIGLLLCGCTTRYGTKVETIEVPVLRVEKCVKKEDIPTRPDQLGELPSNLETAMRIALAKIADWKAYGNQVDLGLQGCAD